MLQKVLYSFTDPSGFFLLSRYVFFVVGKEVRSNGLVWRKRSVTGSRHISNTIEVAGAE